MFVFAILVGVYSYLIFLLGLFGFLYWEIVVGLTLGFWGMVGLVVIRSSSYKVKKYKLEIEDLKPFNLMTLFVIVFALQAFVNLIGVLGPELAFDALWYHLTLPKLWLINHRIDFIPGGLLYYNAMPKLGELLYVAGLVFGNEILVKFIHFCFGLFTCLAIYKLGRKFFSPFIAFLAVFIFYSNLVIAWESMTSYIDLIRTFFEVMALWALVNWWDNRKWKWFVLSALMVGLAITTKLLAIGSLVIFVVLIVGVGGKYKVLRRKTLILHTLFFILIALSVPLPWFVFSYLHTGNPVYPFFTDLYKVAPEPLSFLGFFREVWILFTQAADPISPLYMMFLPLIVLSFWIPASAGMTNKSKKITGLQVIGVYCLLAIIVWYFTPRTGGGRFIVPYLPALSILCVACFAEVNKMKTRYGRYLSRYLLGIILVIALTSLVYRFAANYKYLPVILGQQSKQEFLTSQLQFDFGDFYDTDGYFARNIRQTDRVLLIGFHNLYYVDFLFVDSSWRRKEDRFNYVATQNTILPDEFKNWELVYTNEQTMVKLYRR